MAKKYACVDTTRCVACGSCEKVCPRGAISVQRGVFAAVEIEKCVGCLLCAKTCPAGIISAKERAL